MLAQAAVVSIVGKNAHAQYHVYHLAPIVKSAKVNKTRSFIVFSSFDNLTFDCLFDDG